MTQVERTGRVDSAEAEQVSRLKRYDKRVEEWLGSLKDEAGQRSPEVLGALAAKAKDVAVYLDSMAEKARAKTAPGDAASAPSTDPTSAEGMDEELSKGIPASPERRNEGRLPRERAS